MVGKLLLSAGFILSGGGVRSENRGGTRGTGEWQSSKRMISLLVWNLRVCWERMGYLDLGVSELLESHDVMSPAVL
jgi:hypothetical protein